MLKTVMADCLNPIVRTKCSASKKKPELLLWIWLILINSHYFIPSVYSLCLGVNMTVDLYPTDVVVEYGKPLKLFCEAESVNDTRFTLSRKELDSDILNTSTRVLFINKPERQDNVYFCENMKAKKNCLTHVLVDTLPEPVNNFSCISKNMETLDCSWTNPSMYSALNVSLSWDHPFGGLVYPLCVHDSVKDNSLTKHCVWTANTPPTYDPQQTTLNFDLSICNVFGCKKQKFPINHYAIVKPNPPEKLSVWKIGPHSAALHWKTPFNIIDYLECGAEHIIEYQILKIDNATYFRSVNSSELQVYPIKSNYTFQLKKLPYAHMLYRVRVYIKSRDAKERAYWSNFSSIDFYTLSESPKRPPDTVAGSFVQNTYEDRRFIYIYWKQVEEYEEAGENFTYKVVVIQDNKAKTYFPAKDKSLSFAFCNATDSALQVRVWSMNVQGTSSNSSHLYIPPVKKSLQLSSFTKLSYDNGTYELSWVPLKNIDNYTLFWCIHNITDICTGRMDFKVLNPNESNHIINFLPTQHRYQFAIAANNGSNTSGMVWTKCDISKEGFVMFKFPVTLLYDAPGKTFVNLKWYMECVVQKGIILGYNISYCSIVKTSSMCEESQRYVRSNKPDLMEYTIADLQPYRTYQFTLGLDTIYGTKSIDNATVVITTSEDTPASPRNVTISDVTSSSLVISWTPPKHKNTVIGRYVISNDTEELHVEYVDGIVSATNTTPLQVKLTNLLSFSNYTLIVQACSIKKVNDCSKVEPYNKKFVRTSIGPPSKMKPPIVESNPDRLKWVPPENPGGMVDLYQVLRFIDDEIPPPPLNTTDLSMSLTNCQGSVSRETYQVRAINFDSDPNHGAIYDTNGIQPQQTSKEEIMYEYPGEWSEPSVMTCKSESNLFKYLALPIIMFCTVLAYGGVKLKEKIKTKLNIKPVFPEGLVTNKDTAKCTFECWNPTIKDDKAPSDEMSLLPKSKSVTSITNKHNEGLSENTDKTILSDLTRHGIERQISVSEESSESSLNSETEPVKNDDKMADNEDDLSAEESDSCETPADLNGQPFRNSAANSYVTHIPINNPVTCNRITAQPVATTNYQSNNPLPVTKSSRPPETEVHWDQPTGISVIRPPLNPPSRAYVMASFPRATFFMNGPHQNVNVNSAVVDGPHYNDDKSNAAMNIPNASPSPHNSMGSECLPALSSLPSSVRTTPDSSYVQIETSDSLPNFKNNSHNIVPLKNSTPSSGYVSHADVVDKHLNNMVTGSQFDDEDAILDPTMSANAYTRFSWSLNPTTDNLHSLLSQTTQSTDN